MIACLDICSCIIVIRDAITSIPLLYVLLVIFLFFVADYYWNKCVKISLCFTKSNINEFLQKNMQSFQRKYWPTFYLFSGSLQTLYFAIRHKLEKNDWGVKYERQLVKLKDGGQLSLDWPIPPEKFTVKNSTPIVAILSGLAGGRDDSYVAKLIEESFSRGCQPLLLNERGLSQTPTTTPKLYSGDVPEDVHEAMLAIKTKFPTNPIYGVGLSLGANILTNVTFII